MTWNFSILLNPSNTKICYFQAPFDIRFSIPWPIHTQNGILLRSIIPCIFIYASHTKCPPHTKHDQNLVKNGQNWLTPHTKKAKILTPIQNSIGFHTNEFRPKYQKLAFSRPLIQQIAFLSQLAHAKMASLRPPCPVQKIVIFGMGVKKWKSWKSSERVGNEINSFTEPVGNLLHNVWWWRGGINVIWEFLDYYESVLHMKHGIYGYFQSLIHRPN